MTTKDPEDDTSIDGDDFQEIDVETLCIICNAEFLDPEDLKVHVEQVHDEAATNSRQCQFCRSCYADLESYAVHLRDYHLESFKVCQYCMKVFTDADEHRRHERRHSSVKANHKRCSQCDELFDNISDLEQHEYEHHNNDLHGVLLVDYYPILSSVWNMKAVTLLQSQLDSVYNCAACGHTDNDLSGYVAHLQRRNCRSMVCNTCCNVYKNKQCLRKHISVFKDCSESNAWKQCPECNKYVKPLFYHNHVKLCMPLKCGVCKIVFNSMNELSEHHSKNHPLSIEITMCKFCTRQCVGNASLQKHIARVHQCEFHLYKYKCIECNMPFKHPQKLFAHYFIKHKDIEPYTCKICNKKYRVRKRFTIHIKLDHKSVGFVEFDENYHVFFTDKKSANPFVPTCVIREKDYCDPIVKPTVTENQPNSVKKIETLQNLNLDDLNQTETEANMTEVETKSKKKGVKRKKKFQDSGKTIKKVNKLESEVMSLDSSDVDDDMPLLVLRKRKQPVSHKKRKPLRIRKTSSNQVSKNNQKQLTCDQCQKYCYTYQNYQHHMSLHTKKSNKTCIKCAKDFKTEQKLNKHIKTEHSSSKLTETLKSLLEKRKNGVIESEQAATASEKFKRTIKKAKFDIVSEVATLTVVENGLSVQTFIENFTPETNEANKRRSANLNIENTVSIKLVNSPLTRKPVIRFKKINTQPITSNGKLSLPVKFKPDKSEKVKVNVSLVQDSAKSDFVLSLHDVCDNADGNDEAAYSDNYEETEEHRGEVIPDVGHEVMLEGTEEAPKSSAVLHKIVLPNVRKGDDVSIAHLMPEAPFYKIVKVTDVINNTLARQDKEKSVEVRKDMINLPDGTKFVTVNPLAHLMGEKDLDSIMQPIQNKYYKPKHSNLETLLTKALEKANMVNKRTVTKKRQSNTEIMKKPN